MASVAPVAISKAMMQHPVERAQSERLGTVSVRIDLTGRLR
jgi:hypothetical protein